MTVVSLYKGIKAEFMTLMSAPQLRPYDPLVQRVNSVSNAEDYWIPLASGQVRKLLDTVQFKEMSDRKLTIVNEDLYDSLREDRNTLNDSREYLGPNVQMQINQIVSNWGSYETNAIDALIKANSNAFDGQAYFSTANRTNIASAIGSTGVINRSAGLGTGTTNLYDDIGLAKTAMLSYRDVSNKYFNDPNNSRYVVMCPVDMMDTFKRILDPNQNIINIAGVAVSNPYAGLAQVVTYNTTSHNWMMFNANAPVKPFIVQMRQEPEWYMEDDQKSKYVDFWYKARMGVGFGSPFCVHQKVNA